jgi:hypothetical protein
MPRRAGNYRILHEPALGSDLVCPLQGRPLVNDCLSIASGPRKASLMSKSRTSAGTGTARSFKICIFSAPPNFPDIVPRGASRLNPRLRQDYGRLPRQNTHCGGYYAMTKENWPLIEPMKTKGAFLAGALSGCRNEGCLRGRSALRQLGSRQTTARVCRLSQPVTL